MELYPIFCNVQLVLFIVTLLLIANIGTVRRWERRAVRWIARLIRRLKAARQRPRPAMTAEEVIEVCRSLR